MQGRVSLGQRDLCPEGRRARGTEAPGSAVLRWPHASTNWSTRPAAACPFTPLCPFLSPYQSYMHLKRKRPNKLLLFKPRLVVMIRPYVHISNVS